MKLKSLMGKSGFLEVMITVPGSKNIFLTDQRVNLPEHDVLLRDLTHRTSMETLPHNRRVLRVNGAGSQASNGR